MAKTGAQNAITDDTFGMEVPTTQVEELSLVNERNMAKFSKTKEFKVLKEYLENRVEFFQKYLPDGRPLTVENLELEPPSISNQGRSVDWIIANLVIGEFKSVLQAYEDASEAVKSATQ